MSSSDATRGERSNRQSDPPLRILHLMIAPREQSCGYNEFALPQSEHFRVSICCYHPSEVAVAPRIGLYEGNGTIREILRLLREALRQEKPDVVHAHSISIASLYALLRMLGVASKHGSLLTLHSSYGNTNLRAYHRLLLWPLLFSFQKVVCVSDAAYASLPAFYKRLAGRRLSTVPNGVNVDRVDGVPALRARARSGIRLLSVGRLIAIKDPTTIVKALAKLRHCDVELVFVGIGPLAEDVARVADREGVLDRVQLKGLLRRDDAYGLMLESDIYVSMSRGEGMPVAVLEAMACRCTVVLSDIAPHREIAGSADCVRLVPPGDSDALAQSLEDLISLDDEERKTVGNRCREWVARRFSLEAMQREYVNLYHELAEATKSSDGVMTEGSL